MTENGDPKRLTYRFEHSDLRFVICFVFRISYFGFRAAALCLIGLACASCAKTPAAPSKAGGDPELARRGSIEVTARLEEVPEGAIFKRELYNYATVLAYRVLQVHRGQLDRQTIYVAHYNPFKPRSEAADTRVKDVGGGLRDFRAGQAHRMALEAPVDDYYMGGIVNKYFGQETGPIEWAVWTNLADE
jgi:hypothetical protein